MPATTYINEAAPISCPKYGHMFFNEVATIAKWMYLFKQANAMWQWSQYLHKRAHEKGRRPLLINLDETSVPVTFSSVKGTVIVKDSLGKRLARPVQKMVASDKRTYFTHVAMICNDPVVQKLLPQVLFVGAKDLTIPEFDALQTDLPPNVFIRKQHKGWNNADQHAVIIRIIGMVLAPLLETVQPILTFDAVPLHIGPEMLTAIAIAGLWYIVIPARMTALLQPCDTHAFARYKRFLRKEWCGPQSVTTSRMFHMIKLVIRAIKDVLEENSWKKAFDANGLGRSLVHVCGRIRRHLELTSMPTVPASRPTQELLKLCWPRNQEPHAAAWHAIPTDATAASSAASSTDVVAPPVTGPPLPIDATTHHAPGPAPSGLRRLRSKTSVHVLT